MISRYTARGGWIVGWKEGMKQRWWFTLAAALVATVALFAVACGGDDDEDDGGGDAETPAAAETPADGSDDGEGEDDGDNGGGTGSEEFDDVIRRFAESTFTADYDVTGLTDEEVGFADPQFNITKDGPDRFRFDISGTLEGEDVAIIIIDNQGEGGFCVRGNIGLPVEGTDGACFTSGPFEESFGSITQGFEELGDTDFEVLEESERTIAGEDAKCYRVRDLSDQTETDICVHEDGALLYFSDGETTFEATSFSDEVDSSQFDLPYEVQEIPGF